MPMVGRASATASKSRTPKRSPRDLNVRPLLEVNAAAGERRPEPIPEEEEPESEDDAASQVCPAFANFMSFVIVLSALRLGVQCQWPEDEYPNMAQPYLVADLIFITLFMGELVIKWLVLKHLLFKGVWNILDIVITVAAACDMVVQVLPGHTLCPLLKRVSMLRFLRIFRLIRVLKGIDELVVVVDGIIKAMSSVAWVFLLLLIIMYMFGVFITMEIGRNEVLAEEFDGVNYFGDLAHSMLTLLDIALLAEWPKIVRPIMYHYPLVLPLLLVFMMISTFGVMNILIGVIVDKTAEARAEKEMLNNKEHLNTASTLWKDALHKEGLGQSDLERHKKAGTANMDELLRRRRASIHQVVQVVLDSNCIDFPAGLTPEDVVNLLDFDGNNDLCHEEFTTGLGRLLLGNEFQLTCLMLTMMGKMRKETRVLIEGVQEALEQDQASIDERIHKIEEKIWLKLQVRSALQKKAEAEAFSPEMTESTTESTIESAVSPSWTV